MLQSRWLILFCDRKVFCGPPLLGEGKKWVRQWLVLAAQPTSSGLFACSWTEDEELLNWTCHLMECQGQCLIFGVFLDLAHWVTFLSLLPRRAMERCIVTLTLLKPPKECKQVFVAYLKIWKQNFCWKFTLISKLTGVQIICIPLGGYLCCKFTKDWSQCFI